MKIGAIVQARSSSSRFPNKILKDLPIDSGINMLQHVIRRLKKSEKLNEIIIATTNELDDQRIVNIAKSENVRWFTGSLNDLLSRYYNAAKAHDLDVIVRITSDCPCIDPILIDEIIKLHINKEMDYSSNVKNRTFPRGLDIQVFNFAALEMAYNEAKSDFDREHVCPYFFKTNPNAFKEFSYEVSPDNEAYGPQFRITVDTEDDYILLCALFDYLYSNDEFFESKDIIKCFHNHPWLKLMNQKIVQKRNYESIEDEINEAIRILNLQGLSNVTQLLKNRNKSN